MILVLTNPYNPGDADPGKAYTHLHLEQMVYNSSAYVVTLSYAYGSLDQQQCFVPGKATALQSVTLQADALNVLLHKMAAPNEPALPAGFRFSYEHLQSVLGIGGTLDYDLPASPGAAAAAPSTPDTSSNTAATADPAPTSTEPAPTSTEPAPTSTEPAPTSTEPAPTSTEPAPTSTEPAPTSTEPA